MLRWVMFAFVISCAKPAPVETVHSQIGAGLLVAAPIARVVANQIDNADGAVGCIVGETLGSTFESVGRELTFGTTPTSTIDICECLAGRDDWSSVDVSNKIATQTADAIEAVSLLVRPYIRDCVSSAWFGAAAEAISISIVPVSEALSLESCVVPIPPIVPNLESCHE